MLEQICEYIETKNRNRKKKVNIVFMKTLIYDKK
jgi:hypothetical protein